MPQCPPETRTSLPSQTSQTSSCRCSNPSKVTAASAGEAESAESIVVDYSVTRQEGLKRRPKSTIQFLLFTHNTGFLYTQVREGNPEGGTGEVKE